MKKITKFFVCLVVFGFLSLALLGFSGVASAAVIFVTGPFNSAGLQLNDGGSITPGGNYFVRTPNGGWTGTPSILINLPGQPQIAQVVTSFTNFQINFIMGTNWPIGQTVTLQVRTTSGDSSPAFVPQFQIGSKDPAIDVCGEDPFLHEDMPIIRLQPSNTLVGRCPVGGNVPVQTGSIISFTGNAFAQVPNVTSVTASAIIIGGNSVGKTLLVTQANFPVVNNPNNLWNLSMFVPFSMGSGTQQVQLTINGVLMDFFSLTFTAGTSVNGGMGDANLDGIIASSTLDSLMINAHFNGTFILTGQGLINADVTGEGTVNGVDAIIVGQFANGTITIFPAQNGSVLLLGDANRNGVVSIGDALVAANFAAGLPANMFGRGVDNADVNGDGRITIADAMLIANFSGGLITSFPRVS